MSYTALKPKTKRTIESDLKTLFSPRAFFQPTIEVLKKMGIRLLYREIDYKGRKAYLSDVGAAALRRLTEAILELPSLADIVSQREVATAVKEGYNDWIEKHLQPDGPEFASAVADALLAKVQEFQFLVRLDGLDIRDQETMQLGPVRIQRPDRAVIDEMKGGEVLTPDLLFKEFNGGLWLIGKTAGSPDVALERFELQAQLTVGILAVCGAILFQGEGVIWSTHVRALLFPTDHRAPVSLLKWQTGGEDPSLTRKSGPGQDLPLDKKRVEYLTTQCFLQQMASLVNKTDRDELQNAIVSALYWMADAYGDRNPTMQFVKLWSCIESFFAITDEKISEANARGNLLAPRQKYSEQQISPYFWPNGKMPVRDDWKHLAERGFEDFRLKVGGLVERPVELSLKDLEQLGETEEITMHHCIQGWSGIAKWGGIPLQKLVELVRPKPQVRVVAFFSFGEALYGGPYYDTQSLENVLKPQCLLASHMNGQRLQQVYGAPLRLRVENQLGYKMVKWIERIEFIESETLLGKGEGGANEDDEYFDLLPNI